MNGDTKQILHLLKVCLFVWEEAKPWISTEGLYKGGKDSGCLRKSRGKGMTVEETWQESNLGKALCDKGLECC